MKSKLYCKILAIGIIVLFMGVSVSSGFAIDTNQPIRVNQSEECKECEKSDSEICELLFRLAKFANDRMVLFAFGIIPLFEEYKVIAYLLAVLGITLFIRYGVYFAFGYFLRCDWAQPFQPSL